MLINPIVIIATCAIILFSFIYAFVNRPAKPMLTGVFLVLFIVYLGFCSLINLTLDTAKDGFIPHDMALSICSFLTALTPATSAHLEDAFDVFRNIDIALFAGSIIAMVIELRSIFVNLKQPIDIELEDSNKKQLDKERELKLAKKQRKAEKLALKAAKKEAKQDEKLKKAEKGA